MVGVTALARRQPGHPGRRPPRNPAGSGRPAKATKPLDLAGFLWSQGTKTNRALGALYRQEAA